MRTRRTLKSADFTSRTVKRKYTKVIAAGLTTICLLSGAAANAATKANADRQPLTQTLLNKIVITADGQQLLNPPEPQTSAACLSRHDTGSARAISNWIIGNELYKSYQDPTAACEGFYPYTVSEAHMFLQIGAAATISVALDIEKVDTTFVAGCPVPGDMIYLGDLTDIVFPAAGLYDVSIQLAQPVVVDGPFFLGFFFASSVSAAWELALVTDNALVSCVSYNIWDTAIGYVDLGASASVHQSIYVETDICFNAPADAGCFEFDGRVILHTGGTLSDSPACCARAGDANHDGETNISDLSHIISFLFGGGPAALCADEADANGDNTVNISDVTMLMSFLFSGGKEPVCGATGT